MAIRSIHLKIALNGCGGYADFRDTRRAGRAVTARGSSAAASAYSVVMRAAAAGYQVSCCCAGWVICEWVPVVLAFCRRRKLEERIEQRR